MRAARIVNRGRIAPKSPVPIVDSGRTSWSSASIVSTIETQSPEPNIQEQVTQKLQETIAASTLKKKILTGVSIGIAVLVVVGLVIGLAVHFTTNSKETATTPLNTIILSSTTSSSNTTTVSTTTTTITTTTTTTIK